MKRYLIIQSQDPFTQRSADQHFALAKSLQQAGNKVCMLLVQNAVGIARQGTNNSAFEDLLNAGVAVHADSYALAERQLDSQALRPGINIAELDLVVEALIAGDKVIWH